MSGYQHITISGNLGKDPELKTFGERQVCKFSVAVNGYKDHVEWFFVDVWGKQADACARYLGKGSTVTVGGELETREHDGKRFTTLKAGRVAFGSKKQDGGKTEQEIPF